MEKFWSALSTQNSKCYTVGGYSSIVVNGLLRILCLARVILEVGYIVVLCNILILKEQVPIKGVKYVFFIATLRWAVSNAKEYCNTRQKMLGYNCKLLKYYF